MELIATCPNLLVDHLASDAFVTYRESLQSCIDGSRPAHSLVGSTFLAGNLGTIRTTRRRCNSNEVI